MIRFVPLFLLFIPSLTQSAMAFDVRSNDRPNVIFLITDDQKLDSFGFLNGKAHTPHIDRLAAEGVYFRRAYASTSVCTPSRFTCLTGKYASRCQAESFANSISREGQYSVQWNTSLAPGEPNIARVLQSAGYATGMVGKWHNGVDSECARAWKAIPRDGDPADPAVAAQLRDAQALLHASVRSHGFDYAAAVNLGNFGSHPCRALRYHNQEWITDGAIRFLEKNRDRPFYLYMATSLLHGPSPLESLEADPRLTHAGLLDAPLTVQPSRDSALERALAAGASPQLAPATWLDDGIGAVLAKLDELGLSDNTLVILFNDHGVEKAKGSCYEGGVRTPLIVRWRGSATADPCDALVQNIDFLPTILDVCGVEPPEDMPLDGTSLVPLLKGAKTKLRESLFFEIGHTRAVCTLDWKYLAFRIPPSKQMTLEGKRELSIKYAARKMAREDRGFEIRPEDPLSHLGFPGGQGTERGNAVAKHAATYYDADQLYDLRRDPDEARNLAADPEYAEVLAKMKERLRAHLETAPGTFAEFK